MNTFMHILSVKVSMDSLQPAFNLVQTSLVNLKFVLNTKNTNFFLFFFTRLTLNGFMIKTFDSAHLERVASYKCQYYFVKYVNILKRSICMRSQTL